VRLNRCEFRKLRRGLRSQLQQAACCGARRRGGPPAAIGAFAGAALIAELIAAGGCDILQPDARRTGGPSEWMEIAGLAAANHVPIASHGGDGVTAHLLMATPTAIWCETGGVPKGPGAFRDRARIEGGYVYAPEGVGFGTELREEFVERFGV